MLYLLPAIKADKVWDPPFYFILLDHTLLILLLLELLTNFLEIF